MYMEQPKGLEHVTGDHLGSKLKKSIYGFNSLLGSGTSSFMT